METLNKITEKMMEHVCDKLCKHPHMVNQERLEEICTDCKMGQYICDILNAEIEFNSMYMAKCKEVNKLYNQMMENEKDFERAKEESLTALELAQIYATLNHYKKLQEQGRLIELPCKVGDVVYWIDEGRIAACKIFGISFKEFNNKKYIYHDSVSEGRVIHGFYDKEIGKTVFLTREEAEKALEEKQELKCGDCQLESGDGCENCTRNKEIPESEKENDNYYHDKKDPQYRQQFMQRFTKSE